MKKRFIAAVLCVAVIIGSTLTGCMVSTKEEEENKVDKSLLYGMDEPISEGEINGTWESSQVNGFSIETTTKLAGALGCKSFRFRLPAGFIIAPDQYSESGYAYLKKAIAGFHTEGVTNLIGNAMIFPQYTSFRPDTDKSVPRPTDDSYGEWLEAVSDMWEAIATLFPEITKWEVGNEFNSDVFFHPNGYIGVDGTLAEGSGGFTDEEQAIVVTDYMYYASKGLKKGNPDAKCVMPGIGPIGLSFRVVKYFLEDVYTYIESGNAPYGKEKSTDPDDYFDYLGWHPYTSVVNKMWLNENNNIYKVAIAHGDEGKPVIFTEFGFTDRGDDNQQTAQCRYLEKAFEYMLNDMPYVETCCEFRMYTCSYAELWGGVGEVYFGCISEKTDETGFSPRKKAYTIQKIYGGTGDLTKYE